MGGVSLLVPEPCLSPWGPPTLPRSSTRAVSPSPSNAAAGPVSSSPQACHAWLGVPQSQACPCSHILAWHCLIPIARRCLVPLTALPWGGGAGTGPGCSQSPEHPQPLCDVITFPAVSREAIKVRGEVKALL